MNRRPGGTRCRGPTEDLRPKGNSLWLLGDHNGRQGPSRFAVECEIIGTRRLRSAPYPGFAGAVDPRHCAFAGACVRNLEDDRILGVSAETIRKDRPDGPPGAFDLPAMLGK